MMSTRLRDKEKLFIDKDFMFLLYQQTFTRFDTNDDIFNHIVNVNMCVVKINNTSNKLVIITRNCCLNIVQKYEKKNCYTVTAEKTHLAVDSFKNKQQNFNKRFKRVFDKL